MDPSSLLSLDAFNPHSLLSSSLVKSLLSRLSEAVSSLGKAPMNKNKNIFRQGAQVSNTVKRMRSHRPYCKYSVHFLRDTERKVISVTTYIGPTPVSPIWCAI